MAVSNFFKVSFRLVLTRKKQNIIWNPRPFLYWKGLHNIFQKKLNDNTMKYVAQAVPGNKIVFTYILKSFIESKNTHRDIKTIYKQVVKGFKIR